MAQSGSKLVLQSSNVTSSTAFTAGGATDLETIGPDGFFESVRGMGSVAALHASSLDLNLVEMRANHAAASGLIVANGEPFSNLLQHTQFGYSSSVQQSQLQGAGLLISHHCSTQQWSAALKQRTRADAVALLTEGVRGLATLPT